VFREDAVPVRLGRLGPEYRVVDCLSSGPGRRSPVSPTSRFLADADHLERVERVEGVKDVR
jgi:hypothetical protein